MDSIRSKITEENKKYMRCAIELAKKGEGWTSPNPLVGAVIVKEGKIIGEGWHERYGDLHAERNAFKNLSESAEGADLYVTLEPCCHHGKQPPCTDAIIEHKIARVFIGSRDPNPLVSGKGAEILRSRGIEVIEDVIRDECDKLNPVFFHYITTGMPYVVMKYAMTLDGKIATKTGASKWITGEAARNHVHELRGRYSAILAGIGTVIADDPMLNCRSEGKHQPLRVIVDSSLRIPLDSQIVRSAAEYKTVIAFSAPDDDDPNGDEIICKIEKLYAMGVETIDCSDGSGHVDMTGLMKWLGSKGIDSVLVEGGGTIHESLMKTGLVNIVMVYVAPKLFGGKDAKTPVEGEGVSLPDECMQLELEKISRIGEDLLLEYKAPEN